MPVPDFGPTLYDQLGAPRDADEQTLKRAWRAQLRATHPDTTGVDSHVQYDLVQRAWEVLGDPKRRAVYDAWLETPAQEPAPAPAAPRETEPSAGGPTAPQAATQAPAPVEDAAEEALDPRARVTTLIVSLSSVAVLAGVAAPLLGGADEQETQVVALAAAVLSGIGAWTARTAGWRPKAMLVALGVCAGLGALLYISSTLPGSDVQRPLVVPIGMGLVVLGSAAATWRLAMRRRAKYDWSFD